MSRWFWPEPNVIRCKAVNLICRYLYQCTYKFVYGVTGKVGTLAPEKVFMVLFAI